MMRKVQEAAMKKFGLSTQIGDKFGIVGIIGPSIVLLRRYP